MSDLFKDTTFDMPRDTGEKGYDVNPVPTVIGPKLPEPSDKPVMTALTLDDRRAYPTWPRYDAMDVRNLHRARRGYDY